MPKLQRSQAIALALGALLTVLIGAATPAGARSPFDGRWLVTIRSTNTDCHAAGRYRLQIRNGRVSYSGLAPVSVRGRVDRRGRISVQLNGGRQWARAAGRLSKHAGGGTWRGRSRRRACAGRWWAQRR